MVVPIWKDTIVNIGLVDTLYYRIIMFNVIDGEYQNEVIYSGISHKRPGAGFNQVRINDVCADWLENALPTLSQAEFTAMTNPGFYLQVSDDGNTWRNTGDDYEFINDWSYDYGYNPYTMGMSFPINGRIDARMPVVWSGLYVSEVNATIIFKDGTTAFVIVPVVIHNDFNNDFNNDFSHSERNAKTGTVVFLLDEWDNVEGITINGYTYQVVTECAKYALYYVNAHGGWDSLLVEGNTIEADTLKRYTREIVYDNSDITNRGIHNYVNEITKGFTFHTGWLSDDQAQQMHHLLNSTCVYMYDIASKEMIPVIIPSTSCEYKTYRNQGNQLVNYTIQVQVAQNRIRR